LLELVKARVSVRNLKPDPIPDDYVTHSRNRAVGDVRRQRPAVGLHRRQGPAGQEGAVRVCAEENNGFIYWMEQQRD
jgi:hypothetical protein